MAYLLDTNVLLRFSHPDDAFHRVVFDAVVERRLSGETLYFAPQNASELWNVVTRPRDQNGYGLSPAVAHAILGELEIAFTLLPDVPTIYPHWKRLVREANVSGVQVHDARLVAWMMAHDVRRILTLNPEHFARYTGLAGISVEKPG